MPGYPMDVEPVPGPGVPPPWESVIELWEGVPLDPGMTHTFDGWATTEEQLQFFRTTYKTAYRSDKSSYVYKRNSIRLNVSADSIKFANYGRFRNPNYDEPYIGNEIRGYYFFITNVYRIGPQACEITFEIDLLQTFFFHYELKECLIERETVWRDDLGDHTLPEGIDIGPLIVNESQSYSFDNWVIVVAYFDSTGESVSGGQLIDGVYSGYFLESYPATQNGASMLTNWLNNLARNGRLNDVVTIFMLPQDFKSNGNKVFTFNVPSGSLNGYVPRNSKLYCYPYNRFILSNMRNEQQEFKPELFGNNGYSWFSTDFNIYFNYNLNATAFCCPTKYMGNPVYWDAGVTLDSFPLCTWGGNVYANWYARNQNTIKANMLIANPVGYAVAGSAATVGKTIDTAAALPQIPDHGVLGFAGNNVPKPKAINDTGPGLMETVLPSIAAHYIPGVSEAAVTLAGYEDKANFPFVLNGTPGSSTAQIKWNRVGFEIKRWTPRLAYAEKIDKFFQMYGYKVNRIGIPSHDNREKWDYVKTVGCQLIARFPAMYAQRIKQLYDHGITFWHDKTNLFFYDTDNKPKGGGGIPG